MTYTDDVRDALLETWKREAPWQSWADLRDRLRYSDWLDHSWEPYFEAFDAEHRHLTDIPPDGNWDDYCLLVLETFVEWLGDRVDWQQFDARTGEAHTMYESQGGYGSDQGVYADASTGYSEAQAPAAEAQPYQESAADTDIGMVDQRMAEEALKIFASPSESPSRLTDEHMTVIRNLNVDIEDLDHPPRFDDNQPWSGQ
ncbi:hypothetical protein AB0D30_30975 [Streptomyces sp. NPDC048409]|uniref:hypothetical protein n=1 Tax=Streptomyces sp. NPDC048409 TaxID=3154723 RepID=UPI00341F72C7